MNAAIVAVFLFAIAIGITGIMATAALLWCRYLSDRLDVIERERIKP